MSAKLIDGKSIADTLQQELRSRVSEITASGRRAPALATLLVGADPASHVYVRNKRLACERIGVRSLPLEFGSDISQAELLAEIERLNTDPEIDGILVQLPLPSQIDSTAIIEAIRPEKDVDGFHPYNLGRLAQRQPMLRPCTPFGVIEMLRRSGESFYGRRAIVVGASNHVGRPMGLELLLAGATTTICHRFTRDLAEEVARAEIVIVAVGKPGFIKGDWIAPGATVVDIGINRLPDGKLCGDVEFEVARQRAAHITPVPGGVGPMTVTMLMHNTVLAASRASS